MQASQQQPPGTWKDATIFLGFVKKKKKDTPGVLFVLFCLFCFNGFWSRTGMRFTKLHDLKRILKSSEKF